MTLFFLPRVKFTRSPCLYLWWCEIRNYEGAVCLQWRCTVQDV